VPWLAINVSVIAFALGGWPAVIGGLSGVWLIRIALDGRNDRRDCGYLTRRRHGSDAMSRSHPVTGWI